MNRAQFIAEIATELKQYDEANLIDYRSVKGWIKTEIKRFGNNIMVPTETMIRVENGRAELPENFWKLDLAVKCDPSGYSVESGDVQQVITSDVFRTRVEQSYEWNTETKSFAETDYKQITEKVYIDSNIVNFYYRNPTIMKITKGMKRDSCVSSCKNLQNTFTHNSPWEINIVNSIVQTNFTKGYMYIQYLGLPVDETGDLMIPETQHNHLQEYLMYHCKAKIVENLMGNGDDTNLMGMYQIYSAKKREYFSLAMTESKFGGLSHDWDVKMKNKMRRDTLRIENLFPNK